MTEPVEPMPMQEHKIPPPPPVEPPHPNRSKALVWFTLFLLLAGIGWFCYWFFYLQYHEYTDDAYVNGNLIPINSAINGSVIAFYADDTDLVKEGQLLVLLDPTDYKIIYENELATLAQVVLQVRQLYDTVLVDQASVESKKATVANLLYDYENRLQLVGSLAVSNQDFVHAKNNLLVAQLDLQQAENQLKVAQAAAGNTPPEQHPLVQQQKGRVRSAFYNLQHTEIFAPSTGYIAQRNVNVGQWVTPNTNLMAVIPKNYMWVDANYKETQLTYMRVGQPASVWLDIYGDDVEYKGKVIGIASGTGSVFSIIPPQNATGNWIKIVQRLPVRISLDQEALKKFPGRIGLSAETYVDITNQDLPMLTQIPNTKSISTTNVFDIDMQKANEVIDKVIAENMAKPLQ